MKKLLALSLCVGLCFSLTACGEGNNDNTTSDKSSNRTSEKKEEPLDLTGSWKEDSTADMRHEATITENTIEINWVNSDGANLYWSGSYSAPTEATNEYTWTSTNDHEKTDSALLASEDETKVFTYKDGVITYEASALGETKTVTLKKAE